MKFAIGSVTLLVSCVGCIFALGYADHIPRSVWWQFPLSLTSFMGAWITGLGAFMCTIQAIDVFARDTERKGS